MTEIESFKSYLTRTYKNLRDIVIPFETCSYDKANQRYLVKDQTKCINFDKLSEWVYLPQSPKRSADSLAFNDKKVFLIEFKTGDQTRGEHRYKNLITGVAEKICDSDCTLDSLYKKAFDDSITSVPQEFCLVVDSVSMGIDALGWALAQLSMKSNSTPNETIKKIIPDLMSYVTGPNHYSKIDIWYSEIFSTYVTLNGIYDF